MAASGTDDSGESIAALREEVALGCRVLGLEDQGDLVWGHVSARDPGGRGVWMKASSYGFEEIAPQRVILVARDGEVVEGEGRRHAEYPIHTEVMAARADVGAVVHTHARDAVALAATGHPLRPISHEATLFVPPAIARFTQTGDLILTAELGRDVAAALGDRNALMLVNHDRHRRPRRPDRRHHRRPARARVPDPAHRDERRRLGDVVRRRRGAGQARARVSAGAARPGLGVPRAPARLSERARYACGWAATSGASSAAWCEPAGSSRRSARRKRAPSPGRRGTSSSAPPIRPASSRPIARPSPKPPAPDAALPRWKRSKTISRSSSATPGPSSQTSTVAWSPW